MNAAVVGSLLLNADQFVAAMVAKQLGLSGFGPSKAIGVVRNAELVGGVVFHNFCPEDRDIEVSLAFRNSRWALPRTLRALFTYPFETLDCIRISCRVSAKNEQALRFTEGLGWVREGLRRKAHRGEDQVIFGMLRDECRWLGVRQ